MIQAGSALILMGRAATAIPGVQPANTVRYPRQFVAYVSYDGGKSFGYGTVLDTYTGTDIDGGYSWPLLLPNGQVFVAFYADSHNQQKPDIKSLVLTVTAPSTEPRNSIHALSQLTAGWASQAMRSGATLYALEFQFESNPTPTGSQFSVIVQSGTAESPEPLVNWELPSTHGTDPTADSGFISSGKFVRFLDSFSYGQPYRLRTIIDENQGTQEPALLDDVGNVVLTAAPQPLAEGAAHATSIQIGNNTSLRATDTLLNFIFVRPLAQNEPTVTVTTP